MLHHLPTKLVTVLWMSGMAASHCFMTSKVQYIASDFCSFCDLVRSTTSQVQVFYKTWKRVRQQPCGKQLPPIPIESALSKINNKLGRSSVMMPEEFVR